MDQDIRIYAPPRKPILVIDLRKDQLDLSPELLELAAQHAASQSNQRIQEVHWRIGPHIVAVTHVTERLPPPPSDRQKWLDRKTEKQGRPSNRKLPRLGEKDSQGRVKVWHL